MGKSMLISAQKLIDLLSGDIITIAFNKKTDGALRVMHCTLSTRTIPAADMPRSFNPSKFLDDIRKGNLRVYDVENKGWRTIPISALHYIRSSDGIDYKI